MRISGAYGTHLPALIKLMSITNGPVLELGTGVFSTPYLHYACELSKRELVSYDNDEGWIKRLVEDFGGYKYQHGLHQLKYVKDWKDAKIEGTHWSVALVDHSPDFQRIIEVKRLVNCADYIVIHDSNERHEKNYHYSEVYPLFKYKKIWTGDDRHATVLSNSFDLENLW